MPKRMLIDATHAEETRVAVVDGNRLVEFDYESKLRKQLKGSIFLAKVTRVEPSLQAAFVNFGGNRHGFLPFSEIHPDYFRIPIADREALVAAQQAEYEAAIAAEEAAIAEEEAALAAEAAAKAKKSQQGEEESSAEEEQAEEGEGLPEIVGTPADAEIVTLGAEAEEESEDDEEESEDEESGAETQEESAEEGEGNEEGEEKPAVHHKFVYRGVTEINPETLEILATDEKESLAFDQDLAIKIEEAAKAREDVVRVRLHYRHSENGVKKRSVWVAFHADNEEVDHELALAAEEEAREKHRNGRRGRFSRGRGRNNNGGRGGRRPMKNRSVEILGGEGVESDQPFRPSLHRNYKIQEVIKRGQIMLIQVQKEERGNKGAAVTSYLSLPGRYCVLMPNSPRGGGVSRKIASFAERKRMREILRELGTPDGMSVILRTAGVEREQDEIKRDLDYLMRLWDSIRDLTLQSSAPALVYEESNLVKRAVRDIYASDVEEIQVAGDDGHKQAKDFMKLLMPSSVKKVKHYKDEKIPLFHRYQVENQIAEMGEPVVTLKSGGYLVINPTEALVSIDVNSGRATKERHIEETALKTNLEAADEVARQLRLRDLGGLVVIDFIDMEEHRNNGKVERRLREALSTDRARIQVGRISSFGLMELSRQRLNPSLTEAQFEKCPHCKGVGNIRTVDSATILALRALEEEGIHARASQVFLSVPNAIALYILNQKREMLADIERRYGFKVFVRVDEELAPTGYKLETVKASPSDADEDDEEGDEIREAPETAGNAAEESEGQGGEASEESDEGEKRRGRGRNNRSGKSRDRDDDASRGRSGGRGGRGRRPRTENSEEENIAPAEETEAPVAAQPQKKSFEAKRFGSRRSDSKKETESAPAAEPVAVDDSVAQTFVNTQPSNDVGTPDEGPSSDTGKKKGWWNRLIE
ncbi:MAG TPA: Rne/Rng family ribonuclease [Alphaproteobacteria bacterium]|nr:Rne/Rng family ribonuclease [Alphaproteobacteria bacterium]